MGQTASSYIYPTTIEEEFILPQWECKTFTIKKDLRFTRLPYSECYTLMPDGKHVVEKIVPSGSFMYIRRIVKTSDGKVKIIVGFDQARGAFDASDLFVSIDPLDPKEEILSPFNIIMHSNSEYIIKNTPPSTPKFESKSY